LILKPRNSEAVCILTDWPHRGGVVWTTWRRHRMKGRKEKWKRNTCRVPTPGPHSGFRAHHSSELVTLPPPHPKHTHTHTHTPIPKKLNIDTWWSFVMNILGWHLQD
jgi:hypothetical protein